MTSLANCFLGATLPNTSQPFSVPGNSPDELFYYDVDSTMTSANNGIAFLRVALEGGFSSATGAPRRESRPSSRVFASASTTSFQARRTPSRTRGASRRSLPDHRPAARSTSPATSAAP